MCNGFRFLKIAMPKGVQMSNTVKGAIKALLPDAAVAGVAAQIDRLRLRQLQRETFDVASVVPERAVVPHEIFGNAELADASAQAVAAIGRAFGEHEREGGVNVGDRRALYHLIRHFKPHYVIEVGTHIGASSLHIARALEDAGRGRLSTVDISDVNAPAGAWSTVGLDRCPRDLANSLDCGDRIEFHVEPAMSFLENDGPKADVIFLDGDHSAVAVYREIAAASRRLNPGGVIILHDFYPGGRPLFPNGDVVLGPWYASKRIASEINAIRVLPLGELPWPTKRGSCHTSLALVVANG